MPEDSATSGTEESKDRNFVTALARGLEVLRCFRTNETELTNTDFAKRTGLPKATISRLTYTLCQTGYLVTNPRTGAYRLGAGVVSLGFGVLSGMEIGALAEEEMRSLRDGPNSYVTVAIGERHGLDVVYLAVHRSRENVSLSMQIGERLPLFSSAMGRAILVGMTEGERNEVFALGKEIDPTGETSRIESYQQAVQEFDAQGFCTGFGIWRSDVNGIAAPVYSLDGERIFAMNVGGPSFHVKKRQLVGVYARRLKRATARLNISKNQ